MVKYFFLCARRKNVIVIMYIAMSNHAHVAILARDRLSAEAYQNELKRCYSLYFSHKYKEKELLRRTKAEVDYLDTDWYVRNALAYIPRNALDTGCRVEDYRWSGYRAMFRQGGPTGKTVLVRSLGREQTIHLFHTRDRLSDVPWQLDTDGELLPETACDKDYLESAFYKDQAIFLKTIGGVNTAEMKIRLLDNHYHMHKDTVFFKIVDDLARQWFNVGTMQLTPEQQARLIPFIKHTHRTTATQLARCFGAERSFVESILKR